MNLPRKKTTRYLALNVFFFFGKKVLKTPSGSCSILSCVFDFPNGKLIYGTQLCKRTGL